MWLASIRNMVRGAVYDGISDDHIYDAVVQAIDEARAVKRD
jgi:hypothetical protein